MKTTRRAGLPRVLPRPLAGHPTAPRSLTGGVRLNNERNGRAPAAKPRKHRKRHGRGFKIVMTIVLILVITMAMLLCMSAAYIKNVILPEADLQLADVSPNLSTTIYCRDPNDANGNYMAVQTLYGSENRIWVGREEIPEDLLNAAVAIEDKRFYKHSGVDWIRTVKGITCMFTGAKIQGGSTITQQLIKNITGDDDVTVKRKITEIFRALEFEKKYEKDDILEWYLNYIYLGEGCRGVYTASYTYFGKHVSQLSLAECASLIGITNNPSKYDPYSPLKVTDPDTGEVTTAVDFNKRRQETILDAMCEQKMITQEECDAAKAEPLEFERGQDGTTQTTIYSWYVEQVITDVMRDLQTTYDLSEERAKDLIYSGGLQIYTCMDYNVQSAVDEVYNDRANLNYTSATGQTLQSAITVIDNETGNVVAMAGGVGEKTGNRVWNRATKTLRPPGSSIKPLSVYAPAIELGKITPISTEVDSPYDTEKGWPVNANGRYVGRETIAQAVEDSTNTVAVKVLANYVTPEVSYQFMKDKFHITSLVESRVKGDKSYSDIDLAPLALGGLTDGVSTYEMAAAYSVFPRQGTYMKPRTYTLVLDSNKNTLLSNDSTQETVLSQRTSYYITSMLQKVVSSGTGTAANFSGQDIAGKTGTTSSRKDLWFVGYTPYYTAAVWTGYDNQERLNTNLRNPSTVLWKQVMSKVHQSLPYQQFTQLSDLVQVSYCTVSGKLPTAACAGHVATAWLAASDAPTTYCDTCRIVVPDPEPSDDPNGGEDPGAGGETGGETGGGETPPAEGGETGGG